MKKYLQFAMMLLMGYLAGEKAQAQQWEWAVKAGGIENDYVNSIEVDRFGNSYVTGKFKDSISFGSTSLINSGLWSVYIAKYDSQGELLWDRIVASDSLMSVSSMDIDNDGNIAIVGQYKGTASFYGKTIHKDITSNGDFDIFVAKLNEVGEIIWANTLGGPGVDYCGGVSNDNNGSVYLTGDFHVSPFQYSSSKIFVAKYDEAGNNSWLTTENSSGSNHFALGLKTDKSGNSYVTGQFFNRIAFDSTTVIDAGNNPELNIFIAKFDSFGKAVWGQKAGAASGYCGSNAIDIDVEGNAYITGFYHGTILFGSKSITGTSGGANDVFVAKYNKNGINEWVSTSKGAGLAKCISVHDNGSILVSGDFSNSITFGTTTLSTLGLNDIFVTELNPSGNYIWATEFGGLKTDNIKSAKFGINGIYLTGNFTDVIHFGSSLSLIDSSSTLSDVFVSKLNLSTEVDEGTVLPSNLKCFPNPAENEIEINGINGKGKYKIYDISGSEMMEGSFNGTMRMPIQNLCSGAYFISIHPDKSSTVEQYLKFIKK